MERTPFDDRDPRHANGTANRDSDTVPSDKGETNDNKNNDSHDDDHSVIAKRETKTLYGIKLIVVAVLLVITALLATGIYFHTSRTEEQQFQEQFNEYANKVLEDIGDTLEDTLEALDLLAINVASSARKDAEIAAQMTALQQQQQQQQQQVEPDTATSSPEIKSPWPTVTASNFGLHSAKAIALSKIKVLVMCVVVTAETRAEWEEYTDIMGRKWVDETVNIQETDANYYGPINREYTVNRNIHGDGRDNIPNDTQIMFPSWQAYPVVPGWPPYNFNYLTLDYTQAHNRMIESGKVSISEPYMLPDPNNPEEVREAASHADFYKDRISPFEEALEPASEMYFPVFDSVDRIRTDPSLKPVAGFAASFYWRDMFQNIIPSGANDMIIVTKNPCAPSFTYRLTGPTVTYVGRGDLHDLQFNDMGRSGQIYQLDSFRIRNSTYSGPGIDAEYCPSTFHIYPSRGMKDRYKTNDPIIFTIGAIMICAMTSFAFLLYDFYVERRQKVVMITAERSNAVVSSLFPADVRDQLYNESGVTGNQNTRSRSDANNSNPRGGFGNHQDCEVHDEDDGGMGAVSASFKGKPIASLYPSTTVMFADIVGFTSWSAEREPTEVFTLLESIYGAFDSIAKRRGVFKVETIGDCYVAVCGLPTPHQHHAAVMARFACDCRSQMGLLTQELSVSLGPQTAELKMRFGLNSGATTAGVLRGLKSRFQLFGDTVNTAARMESTGMVGRIQASQATADALIRDGKLSWVVSREDVVVAKGKGMIQTYWIEPAHPQDSDSRTVKSASASVSDQSSLGPESKARQTMPQQEEEKMARLERLVEWNFTTLKDILKQLSACSDTDEAPLGRKPKGFIENGPRRQLQETVTFRHGLMKAKDQAKNGAANSKVNTELPSTVQSQLKALVLDIALLHKSENPFHNFEHATHVAMGSRKLLLKVANDKGNFIDTAKEGMGETGRALKSAADPLVQFALFFSALVHDIDHPGTPNHVLVNEGSELAQSFANESIAEQNSIMVGWELLMSKKFDDLRGSIFATDNQIQLFQQILVHAVMATDIFDKGLKQFRDERWEMVFSPSSPSALLNNDGSDTISNGSNGNDDADLRMTITIEHLLQMSDLSHTMQHFTIYERWNHHLFREMRKTYRAGRTDQDPAEGWYRGELWFFDSFVLPLARKSKASGIFGNVSDEALGYAENNRLEWEKRGQEIVRGWMEADNQS